jgi:predicted nucleotidyltransferase
MKKEYASRDGKLGSHGNKTSWPHKPDSERWPELSISKVPADSVPYGDSNSRNGRTVWAAFHNDKLIAVGATHDDARRKYRDWTIRTERT